jgi:hypothetical protein
VTCSGDEYSGSGEDRAAGMRRLFQHNRSN